jgi:hypothetical protein
MKDTLALACMWLNDTHGGTADRPLTYVPETFSDKPAPWAQWKRDDEDSVSKNGGAPLPLAVLLAQQEVRMLEANQLAERRHQYERKHTNVLGKTADLSKGKLDSLLARTKELTRNRDKVETK